MCYIKRGGGLAVLSVVTGWFAREDTQRRLSTMKLLVALSLLMSCAVAQRYQPPLAYSSQPSQFIPILSYVNEHNHDGSYRYSYETGNGISAQEQGYLKNPGQKDLEAQTAQGSYSYTAPDGTPITVTWYADETGFHAEGAHLPTPPPIPEAIAKSLALQGVPVSQPLPGPPRRYYRK